MKNFYRKIITAVIFASICCVKAFAGAFDDLPIFPYVVPKAWGYEQYSWMSTIPGDTPLNKISMVSSHDAGMDRNSYPYPDLFFATQNHNIYQQAKYGVRFFDLRIEYIKGAYYAYHGQSIFVERGILLAHIFEQATKFLHENSTEVLIFELSHWYSEDDMKNILDFIRQHTEWTKYFYTLPNETMQPPILNEVALKDVRGKLLIVIQDKVDPKVEDARQSRLAKDHNFTPAKGYWQFAPIAGSNPSIGKYGFFRLYDEYSNTGHYDTMRDDQAKKFHNFITDSKYDKVTDAFLYCWQLTGGAVIARAEHCNPHLDSELGTVILKEGNRRPNLVNLDFIDERICNIVINTNADLCLKSPVRYLNTRTDDTGHKVIKEYQYRDIYYSVKGDFEEEYTFINGWYIIEGNVNMKKGARVIGEDVHIILTDGCNLNITGDGAPGIKVQESHHNLHIYSQSASEDDMGKMIVTGGYRCAAIGGSSGHNGNNIYIHGGNITAMGGVGAAAIGGGYEGSGDNIKIFLGIVEARSCKGGAAIGGGCNNGGAVGKNIVIYGGHVIADASDGSTDSAGIGGGSDGTGENITIYGGEVYAKGAAAIGGGKNADGKNITIAGGKIYAKPSDNSYAAGIGGGHGGSASNITISGGDISITGSLSGAGIGGGCKNGGGADASNINITGGTIVISNIHNAYSIGSADNGSSIGIRINGGSVWAQEGRGVASPSCDSNERVYEVTVPDCGDDGSPVFFYRLPSYGNNDLFSKDGKVKLWLPNGTYYFYTGNDGYYAYVDSKATEATIICRCVTVTVGASEYVTLYSDKNLLVPEGVEVFAYDFKYGTDELNVTSIGPNETLPANQGYVIRAREGQYLFFESHETPTSVTSILKGVLRDTYEFEFYPDKDKYGLGKHNGKTAFYLYTSNIIRAGKAYLIKDKD